MVEPSWIAGSIVSIVCVVGTVLMFLIILGSFRIPSIKSGFGILLINQNMAELVACLACFFVFFFGYTLGMESILDISYFFGGITVVMLHIILLSFFMISMNRFCAIAFPIAYQVIFGQKCIMVLLCANWFIPLVVSLFLLVVRQCVFSISDDGWYFREIKNEICGSSLTLYRAYPQIALIILTLFSDLLTLCLLLILRNQIYKLKSAETKKREMNFARQVLVQGVVFLMHGIWYESGRNVMPAEMSENWKIFWTTSFSANILHVFDPMIVFLCNLEFRTWLFGMRKVQRAQKIMTVGAISSSIV